MQTILQDVSGTHEISLDALLRGKRCIFVEGEIDHAMSMDVLRQLMAYAFEDDEQPIHILINSPGGLYPAGMLIYDAIHSCQAPVRMYCVGIAASMAGILFISGEDGRYILPHARVMIHEPRIPIASEGERTASFKMLADSLADMKSSMDKLLAKHTKQPLKRIAKWTHDEKFFSAEDAVKFGMADGICGIGDIVGGV